MPKTGSFCVTTHAHTHIDIHATLELRPTSSMAFRSTQSAIVELGTALTIPTRQVHPTSVFVLATRWDSCDRDKLQELEKLKYNVFSVNSSLSEDPKHVEANFKTVRAMKKCSDPLIAALRAEADKVKLVIAVLDHAWLATGYYQEAYGVNWVPEKASALLAAGVAKIYLPLDKQGFMEAEACKYLQHMDAKSELKIDLHIPDDENPFHVASMKYCESLSSGDQDQKIKNGILNYTEHGRRFCRVEKGAHACFSVSFNLSLNL